MKQKKLFIFSLMLAFVLCCFMTTGSWAAKEVKIYKSNAKDFIKKLNENKEIGPAFGLSRDEAFVLIGQVTDFNGETHYRYQQTFNGVPVWGIRTVISKKADKVIKLHGSVVQGAPNDVGNIPKKLDALAALREMQEEHRAQDAGAEWKFINETYGTYVYFHKKSSKARLCYVVSYFADTEHGNPSQPIFMIDVKNGKVIDSYDMLRYAWDGTGPGGNLKVGYYYYGTDYSKFGVAVAGSTCTMNYADCRSVNLNHGTSGTTPYSYTCYENTFKEINGAYSPINDAQFFGQTVYNMYQDWYSTPVLPFQLMMRVHYSTNYENAFWNGSSMTFGDGYTTFYPLVSLDVSAHEVAHGFTENHSGLIYSSQSGGINESYSDMAGEAAKYYMRDTNDFMCGYDIFKNPSGALRYLYDPPLDGISIDHVDDYYEGMDVHYSSGVFNKAFYLIAVSPGWTTRMSFDIFTRANMVYWTPGTTFQQGAEGALDAALDLGYSCGDVVTAFATVGITLTCPGPPVAGFVGSPTSGGSPLTVNFTDQSTNSPTSWSWNFGDTGTSTAQNPSHTYTTPGTYTVSLTATNASGSDTETKTNYITVLAPQPPVADFTASSTSISVGDSVTFTDTSTNTPTSWSWTFAGGTPGTSTAQNPTITYNTVGTFDVSLTATNAQGSDTETKIGYINVADKPYCTSSGGSQSYEYIAGVVVADLNNSSGASPYTDFTGLTAHLTRGDSASVSLTPGFVSSSYTEWWKIWIDYNGDHDFEDTGEEVFAGSGSSVVTGSFTVPGTAPLGDTRMRVSMSYSTYPPICGSFTYGEVEDYTANISGGCQAPVADFSASATTITEGDSVTFTDLSTNSPNAWDWVFAGGTPGTSTLQNPTITYNTAGTYTVTLTATNACGSDVETKTNYITVNPAPTGIIFETGVVSNVGNSWQNVPLTNTYTSPVVVCSTGLLNSSSLPAVVRVRNASGNSFDVMVQNPSGSALSGYTVHYFVVEEGVYTLAGDGVKMEAVKVTSTATAHKGAWVLESQSFQNSYTSPVVLGQVMTNNAGWSVFWASGTRANPPSAATFNAGKQTGEDLTSRANETIGYVVFEQGSGTINSTPFTTAVGADLVRGPDNTSTGYTYNFSSVPNANVAIVSVAGLDGGNGGWPAMYGASPLTSTSLTMVFDEDQVADAERAHTPEQVAYIVFGQ
jgi:Zn-dependent metalloprotease/plastocyanin